MDRHPNRLTSALLATLCLAGSAPVAVYGAPTDSTQVLVQVARLKGGLSPKSVVWNGHGLFFAQNMMYRHSVAVFDDQLQRCGTISDRVVLEDLGICDRPGSYRGAPVECAFSADGRYAFVSNYRMEGEGFDAPGCDGCSGKDYDGSFVYKVDTGTMEIVEAFPTGSVPKYLTLTPDDRYLLVSNWSSGDLSVIDLANGGTAERVPVGRFPRGIAVDPDSRFAYIALMGSNAIKRMDLATRRVEHFVTVGRSPRHLCLDSQGSQLYASLNHEGSIARIDLESRQVDKLWVGDAPRSMVFGRDQRSLYVVNYGAASLTKVDLGTFCVAGTVATDAKPIGITYDQRNQRLWVACYSGSILVFEDRTAEADTGPTPLLSAVTTAMGPLDSCVVWPTREVPAHGPEELHPIAAVLAAEAAPPNTYRGATGYQVVAGGFRDKANAERHAQRLSGLGFLAQINDPAASSGLHQVVAGVFDTAEEARGCQGRLAELSIAAWIKRP